MRFVPDFGVLNLQKETQSPKLMGVVVCLKVREASFGGADRHQRGPFEAGIRESGRTCARLQLVPCRFNSLTLQVKSFNL